MLGLLMPCGGGPAIALRKRMLLVGRHSACDIPLRFGTVSGSHCELEFRDGYWFVRDLDSSNGTRVNGIICSSHRLLPNDVLSVARYRYRVMYTPPTGQTSSAATVQIPAQKTAVRAAPVSADNGSALGRLLPCGGGDAIPLHQAQIVIGRLGACDLILPFESVSARHCRLEWKDGQWFVRDLGSPNGIRVDGVRCESKSLPPNSVLSIANLRFQIVYEHKPRGGMTRHGSV